MSHTSLWSQIRLVLYSLCKFGEKKHNYKIKGEVDKWIFYYKTYKKYVSLCWAIIGMIQDRYGVNLLIKIKPWMVKEELERRINLGQSAWSIWSYSSALIKLERGIEHFYGYEVRLMPRDMTLPARCVRLRKDRFAYTSAETEAIIAAAYNTGLLAAEVLELVSWTGLRLHEALALRERDIDLIDGDLCVFKGKGGKRRWVAIPLDALELVKKICAGKRDMDLLFPGITERKVRYCIEKACDVIGLRVHKVHNLRHSYATREYWACREKGDDDKNARLKVSKNIGHNRRSVTYAYVPPVVRPGWRK